MNEYEVTIVQKETYVIPVRANSKDRAKDIAHVMYDKRKEDFHFDSTSETEVI